MKTIEFDLFAYSIQAIRRACHEVSDSVSLEINVIDERRAVVSVADGMIPDRFRGAVLDHQIRLDTEAQFRTVRELILAQAFAPCDNLAEIVERCQ